MSMGLNRCRSTTVTMWKGRWEWPPDEVIKRTAHICVTLQGRPPRETGQSAKPGDSQKWVGRMDCLLLPKDNRSAHPSAEHVCQCKKKGGWGRSCSRCLCKDCVSIINAEQTSGSLSVGASECMDRSVISTLPFCKISHWALLSSWYTVLQFWDFSGCEV